jgi:outer membrane biosynthesis protein TonB
MKAPGLSTPLRLLLLAVAVATFAALFALGRSSASEEPTEPQSLNRDPGQAALGVSLGGLALNERLPALRPPREPDPPEPEPTVAEPEPVPVASPSPPRNRTPEPAPVDSVPAPAPEPAPAPAPAPAPEPAPAPAPEPEPEPSPPPTSFDDSG